MKRKIYFFLLTSILAGLLALGVGARATQPDDVDGDGYEVWVIDQSNTKDEDGNGTLDSGGTLYIYQGDDVEGNDAASAVPEVIDFGGASRDLCLAQTGTAPVRPHMFFFNGGRTHAAIASPAIPPNTVELATPLPPRRLAPCTPPVSSPAANSPGIEVLQSPLNSTPPIM